MAPVSHQRNVPAKPRTVDGPSYFSCYECGARFPNLQALGGHKSVHSPKKRRAEKNSPPQPSSTSKKIKHASLETAGLSPLPRSSPMPPTTAAMCPPWAALVSAPPLPLSHLSTQMLAPLPLSPTHAARALNMGPRNFLPSPVALPPQYTLPQYSSDLPRLPQMPWYTQGVTFGTLSNATTAQLLSAQSPAGSLAHQQPYALSVSSRESLAAMQQSESYRSTPALLAEATPTVLGAHNSPACAMLFFEEAAMKLRHIGWRSSGQPVPSLLRASSDLSGEASALSRSSSGLPGFDFNAKYAVSSNSASPAISCLVASSTTPAAARTPTDHPRLVLNDRTSRELELAGAILTQVKERAGEHMTTGSSQSEIGNASLERDRVTSCFELHPGSAWKPWAGEGNRKATHTKHVPSEEIIGHEIDLSLKL